MDGEGPRTCLLIDDSKVVRKIARRIIEDLGFSCIEAENGSQGLQACSPIMPDVVLLDWIMPVMGGLEFAKMLRAQPGGNRPKIIFCTTENDPQHINQALAAGADEYIMKPFDGEIIANKFELAGLL